MTVEILLFLVNLLLGIVLLVLVVGFAGGWLLLVVNVELLLVNSLRAFHFKQFSINCLYRVGCQHLEKHVKVLKFNENLRTFTTLNNI